MIKRYEVIYDSSPLPNRINEDSYYFGESNGTIIASVIDGATPRLALKTMEKLFSEYKANNGATYASRIVSGICGQNFSYDPKQILLNANHILRQNMTSIYGDLKAETILAHEPELQSFIKDHRYIRLALPVAVATIIRIQMDKLIVSYAHAGDTHLFLFKSNGDIEQLTKSQMTQHDQAALKEAQIIRKENSLAHISDAIEDPRVQQRNLDNALYHNFVDPLGDTDITKGVGVINGMVELEHYIQVGEFELSDVTGIFLATDGAILPSSLTESKEEAYEKFQSMRHIIENKGLDEYLQELRRIETSDHFFDTYPRFKLHDDATAIYMEIKP